jgi:hypothetical protein
MGVGFARDHQAKKNRGSGANHSSQEPVEGLFLEKRCPGFLR